MQKMYCTAEEIKQTLPDVQWGTDYNQVLDVLSSRASRAIDRYCKRLPGAFAVDEDNIWYFDGSGTSKLRIEQGLAAVPAKIEVAETSDPNILTLWSSSDYYCWPYNALAMGEPYRQLIIDVINGTKLVWYNFPRAVKITGKIGFSQVPPDDIKQATIIQAGRWFQRGKLGYTDTSQISQMGTVAYTKRIDPEVAEILDGGDYVIQGL